MPITTDTTISEADEQEFFWRSIELSNRKRRAHWSVYDPDEHLEALTARLTKASPAQLVGFEKQLQLHLRCLYTAEIAELSVILDCPFERQPDGTVAFDTYLSDDGFIYFRCWLLLKGREFFVDITSSINSFVSGNYSFNIGDTWAEGLLYVADEAYGRTHDNPDESAIRDAVAEHFPDVIHYDSMARQFDREITAGADLQARYPELVEEMVTLRAGT